MTFNKNYQAGSFRQNDSVFRKLTEEFQFLFFGLFKIAKVAKKDDFLIADTSTSTTKTWGFSSELGGENAVSSFVDRKRSIRTKRIKQRLDPQKVFKIFGLENITFLRKAIMNSKKCHILMTSFRRISFWNGKYQFIFRVSLLS